MLPALLLLVVSALAIGPAMLTANAATQHVAVIAPLWYDAPATVALVSRAGGRIVEMAGFGNTVVATHGEDATQAAFLEALSREGAWLTLDAGALRGCVMR